MHSHTSFSQHGENGESSMPRYTSDASASQQQTNGLSSFQDGGASSFAYASYGNEAPSNVESTDVNVDHFASLLQAAANAGQEAAKAAQEQADQEEQQAREQLQQQIQEHFGQIVEEETEQLTEESVELPVALGSTTSIAGRRNRPQSEDEFEPEFEKQSKRFQGKTMSMSRKRQGLRSEDEFELGSGEHERPVSQGSTTSKSRKRKRGQNNDAVELVELDEDERPASQGSTTSKVKHRKKRQASNIPKPRKDTPPAEDVDALLREDEMWGAPEDETEDEFRDYDDAAIAASTPSVKGAAILFKRPTEKSKNYSRPVMSKIFTSLGIDPVEFLEIQAAAKEYMEDPQHPERLATVGYAKNDKKDKDTAKLNLAGVVESFLEEEGWGERAFGKNAQGRTSTKMQWPKNKPKVITAVTPLLRRIVNNKRQREYQLKKRLEKQNTIAPIPIDDRDLPYSTPMPGQAGDSIQVSSHPFIDPGMEQSSYTVHINIIHDGRRIMPVLILNQSSCPNHAALVQSINDLHPNVISTKVLSPEGLLSVQNEESWQEAIALIGLTEWMGGEVRCVVEV